MEDTREGVHQIGHRRFVGGDGDFWDAIGELQFRFLLDRGLARSDIFIDVACGSLRGGAKFIAYLDPDHYLGIDKYIELIVYGVGAELGLPAFAEKRPRFVVSDAFEFHKFQARPAFGIAQSLFTHLNAEDITTCLRNLIAIAAPGCRFYATFFEVDGPAANPPASHSHGRFTYTRAQMEEFGAKTGWTATYIGDWNHPRSQHMIEYGAP